MVLLVCPTIEGHTSSCGSSMQSNILIGLSKKHHIYKCKSKLLPLITYQSFPGDSDGKNLPAIQETGVGRIPRRREWLPTPVCLPGEFHGQRSLAGYCPRLQRFGHDGATFTSLHPINLIILQTAPPSVTITIGIRFQHVNFGGVTNIHSIELPLEWKFLKGPKGEKSPKQLLGTEGACPRAPSQTPKGT